MIVGNASLYIAPLLALRLALYFIAALLFYAATASNLYHLSINMSSLVTAYGIDTVNNYGGWIINWMMSSEARFILMVMDYHGSTSLFSLLYATLTPKRDYRWNYVIVAGWSVVYFTIVVVCGVFGVGSSYLDWTSVVTIVLPICAISTILYGIYTYGAVRIYNDEVVMSKMSDYYYEYFRVPMLLFGLVVLGIGLIDWIILQRLFVALYFLIHSLWHFIMSIFENIIILSIKKPLF